MTKNMLIDAVHPEETRVVVTEHNQIQEFDFESSTKAPLRGNIYLAKVTRVEPSLQAAFIEYGGNRHGFLAFNEIHPDYYQIPVSDREALLAEQAEEDRETAASEDDSSDDGEEQTDSDESEGEGEAVADVALAVAVPCEVHSQRKRIETRLARLREHVAQQLAILPQVELQQLRLRGQQF